MSSESASSAALTDEGKWLMKKDETSQSTSRDVQNGNYLKSGGGMKRITTLRDEKLLRWRVSCTPGPGGNPALRSILENNLMSVLSISMASFLRQYDVPCMIGE
mmetsp:Transcript_7810/g.12061  ORF Transcript_7810/g.12061 Transcript_7810/m.12061 type:complete len:104 (+) Transcript_7810:561-872(+)